MALPESFHFEDKTTWDTSEIKIQIGWFSKATVQARARRKVPVVVLGMEKLEAPIEKDWGAMPLSKLVRLIEIAGGTIEGLDER